MLTRVCLRLENENYNKSISAATVAAAAGNLENISHATVRHSAVSEFPTPRPNSTRLSAAAIIIIIVLVFITDVLRFCVWLGYRLPRSVSADASNRAYYTFFIFSFFF